ncbi:MAG: glycosyltransferase family 61 protein [Bacteroidota bacterium]
MIFWRGFNILNESKLNLVEPDYYRKPVNYFKFIWINYFRRKTRRISGNTLWVVDEWSGNYYHWLVESLTKILSVRRPFSEFTILVPSSFSKSGFHESSMKLLNLRYEYFDDISEIAYCSKLYLPLNVAITSTANPPYIRKLRDLFIATVTATSAPERIYISRRLAAKRKISNEAAVIEILERHRFRIVDCEKLSFVEQRDMASNANVLIGLHGAGLTNMLFMGEGKLLFELRRENEENFCFENLADALHLKYRFLECKNMGDDPHNSDFYVNLERLEEALKSI